MNTNDIHNACLGFLSATADLKVSLAHLYNLQQIFMMNSLKMLKIIVNNTFVRHFSIKQAAKPPMKYTDTINLPKTKFPNRLNAARRLELERKLVEVNNLYIEFKTVIIFIIAGCLF